MNENSTIYQIKNISTVLKPNVSGITDMSGNQFLGRNGYIDKDTKDYSEI